MSTSIRLSVPDVSCGHCRSAIEGAVGPLAGVASVDVDLDAKTVTVATAEPGADVAAIVAAIEGEGYAVAGREDDA